MSITLVNLVAFFSKTALLFAIFNQITTKADGVSIDFKEDFNNYVSFLLFTKDIEKFPQQVEIGDNISLGSSEFKPTRQTKVIIHEWGTGIKSVNTAPIREAYLQTDDYNIIFVDWHKQSMLSYPSSRKLVEPLGKYVGQFLQFLIFDGLAKPSDIHIIGYGLGAHIAGNAGRHVHEISRITALNPAQRLFSEKDSDILKCTDADFVDVIYANKIDTIFSYFMGKAFFFIYDDNSNFNSTADEPVRRNYFAESILEPDSLKAVKCSSLDDFKWGICRNNELIPIGETTPTSASGFYFLKI